MKRMFFLMAAIVLFFASCDDFFSTSWGKPRQFKGENVTITQDNINDWVDRAKENPALADAVTEEFKKKTNEPDISEDERAHYANGGISTAVAGSGTGDIIFQDAFDDLLDMAESGSFNTEQGKSLANNMIPGYENSAAAQKAADDIKDLAWTCLVSGSAESGKAPMFTQEFINSASPEEVGSTMLLLVLSVASENDIDINSITEDTNIEELIQGVEFDQENELITVSGDPEEKVVILAAYLNLVSQNEKFRDDALAGVFGDLFGAHK